MTDETTRLLYEILQYTRAQAIATVRPTARAVLDSAQKCLIYSLMDGARTQRDIVDASKIPQPTVSRWMIGFTKAGLSVPASAFFKGPKALFTLDELGIDAAASKKNGGPEESVATAIPGA